MSIGTGQNKTLYAANVYALVNTYYACTNTLDLYGEGDRIRLTVANTVANAGAVTIKCQVRASAGTYSDVGGEYVIGTMTAGSTVDFIVPISFIGGDNVKVFFKGASNATSAKLDIYAQGYKVDTGGMEVGDLGDVDLTGLADGNALVYEAATTTWKPGAAGGAVAAADVTYTPSATNPNRSTNVQTFLTQVTDCVFVTTSDDGTSASVVGSLARTIFEGTGNNHQHSLPNATTLLKGWSREYVNASSEIVIIKNSGTASSVWLLPSESVRVICTNTTTAEGTWHSLINKPDTRFQYDSVYDFNQGAAFGLDNGWLATTGGTPTGSVNQGTVTGTFSIGRKQLLTGSAADGRACISFNGLNFLLGGMAHYMEVGGFSISALSGGSDIYYMDIGYGDSFNAAEHADAVLLRYSSAINANWNLVTGTGGSMTVQDSGVPVTTSTGIIRLGVSSNGRRLNAWFGSSYLGTITNGAAISHLCPLIRIYKTEGTTSRYINLDWIRVSASGNTARS
jgi:hypothetical protein